MESFLKRSFVSVFSAFAVCFCLSSSFILTEPLWVELWSVSGLLMLIGLSFLFYHVFSPFNKRRFFTGLSFGFPMGYMILLGAGYAGDTRMAVNPLGFFLALSAASIVFTAFLNLLFMLLMSAYRGQGGFAAPRSVIRRCGFRTFACIYLLTGLFFFVAFLAVYPGIYSYDASVQVLEFFGDMPVTNHHPVLHTLFLCGSLKLGQLLFGGFQAGMAVHSILQAAIVGAVFSYVIWRMIRKGRPVLLIVFSYVFLVVNPYMQILVFVTTKDILFGAGFLLLFLFAADMVTDSEQFFGSRWQQARLFVTALLMCFLRNQGIYVFLFFGVIYLIYLFRTNVRAAGRWSVLAAAVTGCCLVVTGPVFASLGIEKGDPREMLSVPMQQLARAYNEAPDLLTEEETAYITTLIPPQYLEQYVSVNADPVKSGFRTEVMKADSGRFWKTWLSVGRKLPLVYADSFFLGNWGYWYPQETQYWINYIVFDGAFMQDEYNVLQIRRESRFLRYEEYLRSISLTPAFEKLPVVSVLLNQAFPFWMMLVTASVMIYTGRYRLLIPLTLILGYWGTLLLGPVTSVRYVFPLMICVPTLISLLFEPAVNRLFLSSGSRSNDNGGR